MTNKFYKVLGICLLIVLLPVMIVTSVVALTVNTYAVSTEFGEGTSIVYNAQKDEWTLSKVPQRKYYTFAAIEMEIEGTTERFLFDEDTNAIVVPEDKKDAFKNAITVQKTEISACWNCDYDIHIYFGNDWQEYIKEEYRGHGKDIEFNNPKSLESIKLFDTIGYDVTTGTKTSLVVKVSNNKGETWSTDGIDLGYNPSTSGDITISQILDILSNKKVDITPSDYVLGIMLFA